MSKRIKSAYQAFDAKKFYDIPQAFDLMKKHATAKFDETAELHVLLHTDPKKPDHQMIRGGIEMPNGLGKNVRLVVFAKEAKAEEAIAAGADMVGAEDLVEKIQQGFIDFDQCVATPDMMALVSRVGSILGPRNLMPNPKTGTVTQDIAGTVKKLKKGYAQYRVGKNGDVHIGFGKSSFSIEALQGNMLAFLSALASHLPSKKQGVFKRVSLSSTMGPGLRLDIRSLTDMLNKIEKGS